MIGSLSAASPQAVSLMHSALNFTAGSYRPKRRRVLMVVESLARGGAERQMFALADGLLKRGWRLHVFELGSLVAGQAGFVKEFVERGVTVSRTEDFDTPAKVLLPNAPVSALQPFAPLLPADAASVSRALTLVIREFRPRVVHCWSHPANVIGGFVAADAGVPRIVLGQRVLPPDFWFSASEADLYREAYRVLMKDPRVVFINNSAASRAEYQRWMQSAGGTIKVVHNGFLPSSMNPGGPDRRTLSRADLGLPEGAPVVGGLMRFAPEKDPCLWIETAAAVASFRPDVFFLLAGYGHDDIAEQLYQKGMRLGLDSRLVMPGAVTDIGRIYAAMDVFLLTSKSENLPNVLIEAQAAGIPVVGPAVGGIGEAMMDGVTGLLVSDRTSRALADAVLTILRDDSGWRPRVATQGPRFVAEKFGCERMVRETVSIYRCGSIAGLLDRVRTAIKTGAAGRFG